jgi:SAM-dependent MidA family methyltransferase
MKEIIKQLIAASPNQMISYADFIANALYHPKKGYYMKNKQKIGKDGDFYTSSNLANTYGNLLGKWFARSVGKLGLPPAVCEIGGGNGRFARAFIEGWNEFTDQNLTYYLVETSPYHRGLQAEALRELKDVKFIHANAFEEVEMSEGLIFSNELFDAFPVHVIEKIDGLVHEVFVGIENGELIEKVKPLVNEKIFSFIEEQELRLNDSQRIEIPLSMEPFIKSISAKLSKGIMITVDYGYTKEEWSEPSRRDGSLRAYYQHQLHADVLKQPGDMDITSHVHFDALISQGEKYGLQFLQKKRQDEFLICIGILEELADHYDANPFSEVSKKNRAIRSLIMPGSISDSFDVILQGKGIDLLADHLFSK